MRYAGCILLIVFALAFAGCKEEDEPVNPYPVSSGTQPVVNEPDPNTIAGLHKNIFSPKCAVPGCHDGTFEPDFRTIQSSFSSLVYLQVNKTTVDSVRYFNYRVWPGDTARSFLIERLTTSTGDYMPSNGTRLQEQEINHVRNWIMSGAKDDLGNIPVKPNLPPNVIGYIALNSSFIRIDTIRMNNVLFNPFIAPANSSLFIPFLALDTADGSSATDPANFTSAKIKFSTSQDQFTSATTINAVWFSPIPFNAWQVPVSTALWSPGTIVYFRVYLNDGFQRTDVEFPRNASPVYYKSYYAFIVQ